MTKIKIQKLAAVEGGLQPIAKEEHVDGTRQAPDLSLPIEYTIEGQLIDPIEEGMPVQVLRTKRNDVECLGHFMTSLVTEHCPIVGRFKTLNSVYQYTIL